MTSGLMGLTGRSVWAPDNIEIDAVFDNQVSPDYEPTGTSSGCRRR